MATPYTDIYNAALFYFRDEDIFCLYEDEAEAVLRGYLRQAAAEFTPYCLNDLTAYDDEMGSFNADLSDIEVDILALGMSVKWMRNYVLYSDNFFSIISLLVICFTPWLNLFARL